MLNAATPLATMPPEHLCDHFYYVEVSPFASVCVGFTRYMGPPCGLRYVPKRSPNAPKELYV